MSTDTEIDRDVKRVAKALAMEDLAGAGRSKLDDDEYQALSHLCKALSNRSSEFIDKNFGPGTSWSLRKLREIEMLECMARDEASFSSWPIKLAKILESEKELEYYIPFAETAIDALLSDD